MSHSIGPKISSLVSGNWLGENFFISPTRIVKYVSKYTFLSSKNNKQITKNMNQKKQNKLMKKIEHLHKID